VGYGCAACWIGSRMSADYEGRHRAFAALFGPAIFPLSKDVRIARYITNFDPGRLQFITISINVADRGL
jgi:hypothetical protein